MDYYFAGIILLILCLMAAVAISVAREKETYEEPFVVHTEKLEIPHETEPLPPPEIPHETEPLPLPEIPHETEPLPLPKQTEPQDGFVYLEEIPLDREFQRFCYKTCKENNVGYAFFLAMCESESNFRYDASSVTERENSVGLMQINRCNWERYDLDASWAHDNVEIGIRMISELMDKYESLDGVIMAYKGGEGKADQWIKEGFRLSACDEVCERAMHWQDRLDEERFYGVQVGE